VYNNALKGEPNAIWTRTINKIKNDGEWFDLQQNDKYKELIYVISQSFGTDYMKNLGKSNVFGLNDTQMAFVIMMAESGGDPNVTPNKNFKK